MCQPHLRVKQCHYLSLLVRAHSVAVRRPKTPPGCAACYEVTWHLSNVTSVSIKHGWQAWDCICMFNQLHVCGSYDTTGLSQCWQCVRIHQVPCIFHKGSVQNVMGNNSGVKKSTCCWQFIMTLLEGRIKINYYLLILYVLVAVYIRVLVISATSLILTL